MDLSSTSILRLYILVSMLVTGVLCRPRNGGSHRCLSSTEPDLRELISAEKRKLMERISRVTRSNFTRNLPSPPSMLTKLAKKRKAALGKRSLSDGDDEWDYEMDLTNTIYVLGRHLTRGTTKTKSCFTPNLSVATCVEFPVDETIGEGESVERISLWMYYQLPPSNAEPSSVPNRTLEIYEITRPTAEHGTVHTELITSVSTLADSEKGWVEADVSAIFSNQSSSLQRNRVLRIQWREHVRTTLPPVSLNDSKDMPFLEIVVRRAANTIGLASEKVAAEDTRARRHAPHHSHCSIRQFSVNFTEFGWDSWIIVPSGYLAGYCAGECDRRSENEGLGGLIRDRLALTLPCCSPSRRMNPLQFVYADRSKGDENVVYRTVTLPNMVVTECTCR